nr:type II toxin-antitoxin system VapB family antitoxin [uncultured Pseudomonas sp.]
MRTVSIFMKGRNQAVQLPLDMAFDGIAELEISKEGDVITLRPARPSWTSLTELPKADADFLNKRSPVASDEGRFTL